MTSKNSVQKRKQIDFLDFFVSRFAREGRRIEFHNVESSHFPQHQNVRKQTLKPEPD